MWTNITNLWGKNKEDDYTKDCIALWEPISNNKPKLEKDTKIEDYELTESSPYLKD